MSQVQDDTMLSQGSINYIKKCRKNRTKSGMKKSKNYKMPSFTQKDAKMAQKDEKNLQKKPQTHRKCKNDKKMRKELRNVSGAG